MGCCGSKRVRKVITTAEAEAMRLAQLQDTEKERYEVTFSDGSTQRFAKYLDAKKLARDLGGKVRALY